MMLCMKNGELFSAGIDVQDRAFLYGDGFFTTIRVNAGQPKLWLRHLHRLQQCAERLAFQVDFSNLHDQVTQLIALADPTQMQTAIVKVIVSRGVGSRGYLPPDHPADVYLQYFSDTASHRVMIQNTGVLPLQLGQVMPPLAGLKTLNRLEQVLLRQALAKTDWSEALVCDQAGDVIEGVFSNCFFYIKGQWLTPSLGTSGVAGVMREEILHQLQQQAVPYQITGIPSSDLIQVEAMFFCNTLTGIVPVQQLDGRTLNVAFVQELQHQLLLS